MNYKQILEDGFTYMADKDSSRLEFLCDYIFDITTYDSEMSELFADKAINIAGAINEKTTFDFIKDPERYRWYLLMCNMPFFATKLEWGTSIRGAWWDYDIEFNTCGLWDGEEQIIETMKFTQDEWMKFIAAIIEFAET